MNIDKKVRKLCAELGFAVEVGENPSSVAYRRIYDALLLVAQEAAQPRVERIGGLCGVCGGTEWSHSVRAHDFHPTANPSR